MDLCKFLKSTYYTYHIGGSINIGLRRKERFGIGFRPPKTEIMCLFRRVLASKFGLYAVDPVFYTFLHQNHPFCTLFLDPLFSEIAV